MNASLKTGDLAFVPRREIDRARNLNASAEERAALFADIARLNTLSMIAYAGSGHIGTSFSSLDIVSWLFLNELRGVEAGAPQDIFFSSKGHDVPALYAVMIGCGLLPEDGLFQLRRHGGLPGHPDVATPHIVTNTGSLGMGISKAKGMVAAHRRAGTEANIFVMTGDGELQEGQIWESLVSAANLGLGEITAIVDHNKFQSDIRVSDTSDLGDLEAKFSAFGWRVARCDGHDIGAMAEILADFRTERDVPKVLIADTIKGRGVSFMEHTAMGPEDVLYRFHSGAPDAETYGRAAAELIERIDARFDSSGAAAVDLRREATPARVAPTAPERLIPAYSEALLAAAEKNPAIYAMDGDLVLDTGLIPFKERFPERYRECGIAEQDMVSQAGGMALRGLLPAVHSFACFMVPRAAEQIYNNVSEHTKVIYVGSLVGIVPAGPGHSHQSVNDIAILGAMPGLVAYEPACAAEVGPAVDYLYNVAKETVYLRLVSVPCEIPYSMPENYAPSPGVGVTLRDGADAVVIGYGPVLLPQAWHAAEALGRDGLDVAVVNLPWLNRIDPDWLAATIAGKRAVFTLDNHLLEGGQGRMIASAVAEMEGGDRPRVHRFGVIEIPACGQNDEVLAAHGLDAASLAQRIADALRG